MSPIEGLSTSRRLPRLGKIHLGIKHPVKGYPIKTDYFVCPPEVQEVFGDKPKELRVLIPVEDEEKWCSQYYRCYSKTRGLICKGDGLTAMRMIDTQTGAMADRDSKNVSMKEVSCDGRDCPDYKIKCKEIMNLQFLLPEVPGLGVWQIDTSSKNSIININSAAELIQSIYKKIAMIPLMLTLESLPVNNPETGKQQTVYVLNLRVNLKLADLAQVARKQAEIFELPVGDDERPDLISPEFEPDPVELPPDDRPIEEVVGELWGPKEEEPETEQPASEETKAQPSPVDLGTDKPEEPVQEPEQEPVEEVKTWIDIVWLKESLGYLRALKLQAWTESNLLAYMKTAYGVKAATVLEAATKLDKGKAAHFGKKIQDTLELT